MVAFGCWQTIVFMVVVVVGITCIHVNEDVTEGRHSRQEASKKPY